LDEARIETLALVALVTLVNDSEFSTARLLLHLVEPVLIKLRPPYNEAARNALFAAGILSCRSVTIGAAVPLFLPGLRDSLVKLTPPGTIPDALFWPGLRGEVLALHRLNRGADATALLQAFTGTYPGAPDDRSNR